MANRFTIVGLGEALFDVVGGSERLGGAPLNAAVHAHQLSEPRGGRGVLVSRVGQDELGRRLLEELRQRGVTTDLIQTDPDRPTGQVFVEMDSAGNPSYDILRGAAWDMLWFDSDLEDLALTCNAVCFGSLAQREAQTRNAIYRFLETCRRATRLFDVNLRPPFYDRRVLHRSCELSEIVKLNRDELPVVCQQLAVDVDAGASGPEAQREQAEALRRAFELEMVVLTRGEDGTAAATKAGWHEGTPAQFQPAADADVVGAGDASTAAILIGQVLQFPVQTTLDLANEIGGYVASVPEATPTLPEPILAKVKR